MPRFLESPHAYAAATYGAFFDSVEHFLDERSRFDAILVLIRRRTWITLKAVEKLKAAGVKVVVAWKECSHNQVSRQLKCPRGIAAYSRILQLADGILSPTLAWPPRVGTLEQNEFWQKLKFIPTPYPIDFPSWDFSTPISSRVGVMVGTREFKTESRNHLQAIARIASLAHEFAIPRVTVVNSERKRGLRMLQELAPSFPAGVLEIVERPLPYPDYMQLVSSHRLVYQMDRSTVPGQVAGDCLLARTICAGGSSTIEKIAFTDFSDDGTIRMKTVFDRVALILQDDDSFAGAIEQSQKAAQKRLSFRSAARQLGDWEILQ
ncbi:MAG: hypothetical protein AAGC68_16675 [Verrucomicrobiota bacterium]